MKVAFIRKAANSSPLFTALVMIAHAPSLVRSIDATKIAISQQQQRRKAFFLPRFSLRPAQTGSKKMMALLVRDALIGLVGLATCSLPS
jgi:hypothetical protein